MTPNEYQKECERTSPTFEQDLQIEKRAARNQGLLHALLGISSECGEFADALKKHIIYNQPLDKLNLKEEVGDLLWYIALASTWLDINIEEAMQQNIDKLKLRYPEKFTELAAFVRADKVSSKVTEETMENTFMNKGRCNCNVIERCSICDPENLRKVK